MAWRRDNLCAGFLLHQDDRLARLAPEGTADVLEQQRLAPLGPRQRELLGGDPARVGAGERPIRVGIDDQEPEVPRVRADPEHPEVETEKFPGSAPETNPDEMVWEPTKHGRLAEEVRSLVESRPETHAAMPLSDTPS